MRREGRQHGLVRTYYTFQSSRPFDDNPRPRNRLIDQSDSPATAGIYTRVPSKPTNHSKYTGKCRRPRCPGCHDHPVSKSRVKAKGKQKLDSRDVFLNCRLINCGLGDARPNLCYRNFRGSSASRILDELASDCSYVDYDVDNDESCAYTDLCFGGSESRWRDPEIAAAIDEVDVHDEFGEIDADGHHDNDEIGEVDDDDDDMEFVDVGIVWDPVDGDEGWAIVGGMW
ncbi:hypothetical protein Nepgr_008653 [Nepenthes gracilis]|uniref:Uncharacterized protein n=1 Tax=Nepenthes gracilis TaxID=150966 RepID=A0AAD3S929_NEPGR|nr:hypothetical protein Nepgr_008653 [Nepenthes gracilis]